jgi:hypothetical protein
LRRARYHQEWRLYWCGFGRRLFDAKSTLNQMLVAQLPKNSGAGRVRSTAGSFHFYRRRTAVKRLLALLLGVVLALGCLGCGSDKEKGINSNRDRPKAE